MEILALKHQLRIVPLEQKENHQLEPPNDREDQSLRVMKQRRDELMGFFEHMLMRVHYKYPMKT
jgi:hypothetical protein